MKAIFPAAALALALSGCLFLDGMDSPEPDDDLTIIGQGQDWPKLDEFEITDASVSGDTLSVEVAYAGGCREHAFTFYSTGPILKTLPPGADVWIRHDANGDTCEAYLHEWITINLRPIRADGSSEVIVHLLEFDFDTFATLRYTY